MMRLFLAAAAASLCLASSASAAGSTLIIRQTVADYAKWRPAYDAHKAVRTHAGLTNCRVQSTTDNANDVFVICDMADVAKAKAFTSSKNLAEVMTKAGVMGKPEFFFLAAAR